jgi:hypothetical protein
MSLIAKPCVVAGMMRDHCVRTIRSSITRLSRVCLRPAPTGLPAAWVRRRI